MAACCVNAVSAKTLVQAIPAGADPGDALGQLTEKVADALKVKFADRGAVPQRMPQSFAVLLEYRLPDEPQRGDRIYRFEIQLQVSQQSSATLSVVPRIFAELVRRKPQFTSPEGDNDGSFSKLLDEVQTVLRALGC